MAKRGNTNSVTQEDVKEMTRKYGLSVAEANDLECPCGLSVGRKMSELGYRELYWFATRRTTTRQSSEFRLAVCAARILRAHHQLKKAESQQATAIADGTLLDHAKSAKVNCSNCGRMQVIRRYMLDRRNCRCPDCGGQLHLESGLPIDELLTASEAESFTRIQASEIRRAIERGDIKGAKISGRWYCVLSSLQQYKTTRDERRGWRELGVDVSYGHVCPRCKKVFRSFAGLSLHIKDQHEEF